MNEYTFPFTTCEKVIEDGIAQPYSFLINILGCSVILFFLSKTKSKESALFLFLLFCFQLFHAFSHSLHLEGYIQTDIIHMIAFFTNLSFFYLMYRSSKMTPSFLFLFLCLCLTLVDIYFFFFMDAVYYISSQIALFLSILFYYSSFLPKNVKENTGFIVFLIFLLLAFILNEKYNCHTLMSLYPDFPYHIFIEITGNVLAFFLSKEFYPLVPG